MKKKNLKKSLIVVLIIAVIFGSLPLCSCKNISSSIKSGLRSVAVKSEENFEVEKQEKISDNELASSGQCGDSVYWTFDSSTGLLTISGTGDMYDYGYDSPFYDNSSIRTVIVENGVTSIGDCAFTYCENLENITFPDSITAIGYRSFAECYCLKDLSIGNNVEYIGSSAFAYCEKLENVSIGSGVHFIDSWTFHNCVCLQNFSVNRNNPYLSSDSYGVLYNKDKTELIQYPVGNKRTIFTVPDSVKSINNYSFECCDYLQNIVFSNNVSYIGYCAFNYCSSLQSIDLPSSVSNIGERVFAYCHNIQNFSVDKNNLYYSNDAYGVLYNKNKTNLICYPAGNKRTSFSIPNKVINIESYAFQGSNLQSITIGEFVENIGESAFDNCSNLRNIAVGENLKSIESNAFFATAYYYDDSNWENGVLYLDNCLICSENSELDECYIKEGTTVIAKKAFYGRENLEKIYIPDSVKFIGYEAFDYTAYYYNTSNWENGVLYIGKYLIEAEDTISGSYSIKAGTKVIAEDAFGWCSSLQGVIIPNSVITIGDEAFYYCESLQSVTIGNGVTSIGDYAFFYCESLQSVTIPNSVKNIGRCAFQYCTNLQSVTIPDSVTSIGDYAFDYCESFQSVTVDPNNQYYSSDSYGVLYNKNKTKLIQYPIGNERISFVVPSSVTSIGSSAFSGCTSLQSVTIGNSVASIGNYAFNNCCNLTDILYAGTEKEWSEISIGNSNECLIDATIHFEAYCAINGHTASEIWDTVVLPTFTEEGLEVQACEKCGLIINSRVVAKLEPKVFGNFKYCIVDDEVNIIECDENAVSVEIPKTIEGYPVTYVYYDAFYNCDQLKNVTIEADISISYFNDLFEDCINLENVIIGSSVSSISSGAFNNCSNLLSITVDKNNEYYSSDSNGILYFKDKTYIIRYPAGKENTTFEIPSGVKTIGFGSFSGCSNLQTVIIPEGVSLIGDRAFENCDNLNTVYIPKSLTVSAGYGAFHYSDSITDVYYAGSKQDWDNLGGTEYFGLDQNKVTIHFEDIPEISSESPTVEIDKSNKMITCLEEGITSLDEYITKNGCTLSYEETAEGFGTGTKVNVIVDSKIIDTYTIVVPYDVTGDGYCDAFDISMLAYVTNYEMEFEDNSAYYLAGDVENDGFIDAFDLSVLTAKANYEV